MSHELARSVPRSAAAAVAAAADRPSVGRGLREVDEDQRGPQVWTALARSAAAAGPSPPTHSPVRPACQSRTAFGPIARTTGRTAIAISPTTACAPRHRVAAPRRGRPSRARRSRRTPSRRPCAVSGRRPRPLRLVTARPPSGSRPASTGRSPRARPRCCRGMRGSRISPARILPQTRPAARP